MKTGRAGASDGTLEAQRQIQYSKVFWAENHDLTRQVLTDQMLSESYQTAQRLVQN